MPEAIYSQRRIASLPPVIQEPSQASLAEEIRRLDARVLFILLSPCLLFRLEPRPSEPPQLNRKKLDLMASQHHLPYATGEFRKPQSASEAHMGGWFV